MSVSGDNPLPQSQAPAAASLASAPVPHHSIRAWALSARREINARLDAIQRASDSLATSLTARASDHQRANLSASHAAPAIQDIQDATHAVRAALDTLNALLALEDAPLRMAPIEVSDLLMDALSRWKTRAPRHTFELALPGHEPALVGDASRIGGAIDALIAWMVASSAGGDVRVALRYAPPPNQPVDSGGDTAAEEAIISVRATLRPETSAPLALLGVSGASGVSETVALGLTLAHQVAAAHGGRVWASPGPEEGALTLGLALPSTPPLAPEFTGSEGTENDGEPGAAASPSLPLARQRRVALIAHADPRMARYLRANLERAGFRALTAGDSPGALRLIDVEEPDVVLLDDALGGAGTRDALQRALARTTAPIILLTREASPARATAALDAGAADIIAMPFSVEETLARVRRALRTSPHLARASAGGVTICGDLVIDEAERRVTLAGAPITLSKTEYRLLRALARNAGKTVAHESLLEQVWGPAYSQEIEFIWVYIRRLRRKIEPDPARPRYIQTAPGVGYYLAAPVSSPEVGAR